MVTTDLERANQRAEAAQREADTLREQLTSSNQSLQLTTQIQTTPDMAVEVVSRSSLEAELGAKDREMVQLVEDVQRLQVSLSALRESSTTQITQLQLQLSTKTDTLKVGSARRKGKEASVEETTTPSTPSLPPPLPPPSPQLLLPQIPSDPLNTSTTNGTHPFTPTGIGQDFYSPPYPLVGGKMSLNSLLQRQLMQTFYSKALQESTQGAALLFTPVHYIPTSTPGPGSGSSPVPLSASPLPTQQSPAGPEVNGSGGAPSPSPSQSEGTGGSVSDWEDMDTTEIARQIKEQLIKHNIGQRVFGHYVLGLSQGSVSEILARPKPWSKLTIRGKEPFHKMRQFLSDEQNILALRTIQGRQRGETPVCVCVCVFSQTFPLLIWSIYSLSLVTPVSVTGGGGGSDEAIRSILEQARREMEAQQAAVEPILKASSSSSSSSSPSQRDLLVSHLAASFPAYTPLALSLKNTPTALPVSSSSPSTVLDFSSSVKREDRGVSMPDGMADGVPRLGRSSEGSAQAGGGHWREQWWSNMNPDPRRDKPTLGGEENHNRARSATPTLGGEENHNREDSKEVSTTLRIYTHTSPGVCVCVCALVVGSMCDGASLRKPWSQMASRGLRMQLWLNGDLGQNTPIEPAHNQGNGLCVMSCFQRLPLCPCIAKVRHYHPLSGFWYQYTVFIYHDFSSSPCLSPAYLKRRHSSLSDSRSVDGGMAGPDFLQSSSPQHQRRPQLYQKKVRVVLGPEEKEALKRAYQEKPYPSPKTIEELASQLNLKTSTVINWFHNYRSRIRRELFIEEIQAAGSATAAKAGEGDSWDGTESDGTVEGRHGRHRGASEDQDMEARVEAGVSGGSPAQRNCTTSGSAGPVSSSHNSLFGPPEAGLSLSAPSRHTSTPARNPRDNTLRKKKAANLNNIIHRLEKAAGKEDPSEWEF
uniref:One cut domain family member n=1 Tax=Hucho hucho TaxID=62062 RepID=A0A4W5NCG3_9TELE